MNKTFYITISNYMYSATTSITTPSLRTYNVHVCSNS